MDRKRTGVWRFDEEKNTFTEDIEATRRMEELQGRNRLDFVKMVVFMENKTPELVERLVDNYLTSELHKAAEIAGGHLSDADVEKIKQSEDHMSDKRVLTDMCMTLEPVEWKGFIAYLCLKARDGMRCSLSDAAEEELKRLDA